MHSVRTLFRSPWDDGEVEEDSFSLIAEAIAAARSPRARRAAARCKSRRRHEEPVEEAKEILALRFVTGVSLTELADEPECSPFHLCRVFAERTRVTTRRYLGRLRVRAAQERIADGAVDLAALATELGFADHGHMTRTFRLETGRTPSAFRGELRGA